MARNQFRTQLQIEALEQRQLMAGPTSMLNPSTKTLTITGTEQADIVAITQNDTTNKVTVVSGLSGSTTQNFAANLVNRVVVQLGSGDDQFTYKTVRDVWNPKDIQVELGDGDDIGTMQWSEDGGTARTNLNLAVYGAAGRDAFGARIGRTGFNTTTNVQADMGAGDDGFVVQALNPDTLLAKVSVSASGGDGDDELQYFASGSLARSACSTIRLDGESIHGCRLVKPETLARLQLPVPTGDEPLAGYGMGWGVFPAEFAGLDARYGRVLNHLGSDGVWLAEVDTFPDVDFSIQILANGTLDKDGNSLESGAFEEIKLRLFHRFAPKFTEATQRSGTNIAAPAIERESSSLNSQLAKDQPTTASTFEGNSSTKKSVQRDNWQTASFLSGKAKSFNRSFSTPVDVKNLHGIVQRDRRPVHPTKRNHDGLLQTNSASNDP